MALQWLSLMGCIWLQSINGTNTNFPVYSSQLKTLLSLSQLQLNNLAFASDAGKLLGWFSGVAAVYLPLWLVLMIGSTLGLIGYGLQYLFLANQISSLSYSHVFLLTILAGNSICWINTVCYIITIQNFAPDRQVAVGLSTSYIGLSAKIYTDIVDAAFASSSTERAKSYLLLNSAIPLVVALISAPLVRNIKVGRSRDLAGGLIVMFVITIGTGIYSVITSLGSIVSSLSPLIIVIGMGGLLLIPLVIPVAENIREKMQQKCWIKRETRVYDVTMEKGDVQRVENGEEEEYGTAKSYEVNVKEEIGVDLMLRRLDFWLYFFAYFSGATLGLVYLNNLGQIAESRGCDRTSSLVSLSSSFGFFGRLIPSLLDYHFSRTKYTVSRPASIAAMMAPISGAFFLLLNGTNLSLYISTAIIGICTGAITSISVSTTTELFGTKNFGINHNILVTNIPIGSFIFGNMAALFYAKERNGKEGECMGMNCYRTTFIIWGSLCFVGTLLALTLHARNRKFYTQRS